MVPQLIPRDPVNIDGVKPGFNSIRSNIQTNEIINVEIDPTSNAPIAVFDGIEYDLYAYTFHCLFLFLIECDIHIPTNQTGEFLNKVNSNLFSINLEESITIPITSTSPNFPRLTPYTISRTSSSRTLT
jgi:hypothetical protein